MQLPIIHRLQVSRFERMMSETLVLIRDVVMRGSTVPGTRASRQGPLHAVTDLRSVEAHYVYNAVDDVWETVTIFPVAAP